MRLSRFARLSTLLFASTLAAGACTVEEPGYTPDAGTEPVELTRTGFTVTRNDAVEEEHCRVHSSRLDQWPAGRQLLIYRGTTLRGACTVDATASTLDPDTIEMSREYMKRRVWLSTDGMRGTSPPEIVASITDVTFRDETPGSPAAPRLTAAVTTIAALEVNNDDTVREYTTTPTGSGGITVGYLAPHPNENPAPSGGLGKSYLGWKAAHAAGDAAHEAFWTLGFRGNRGHFITDPEVSSTTIGDTKRFHITSTELSQQSFPGLAELAAADLDYAVSLHGQGARAKATCNTNVMVGGLLGHDRAADPLAFRRGVAENLRLLVAPEVTTGDGRLVAGDVKYSPAGNSLDGCNFDIGTANDNIVNLLARDGAVRRGLQLEQGSALAASTYQDIGAAVHEVFSCLHAPADVVVGDVASAFASRASTGTDHVTDGDRCRGFVVDVTFTSSSDDFFAELPTCTVGARVHLDVYRRNLAGSFDRVAGGTRTYTSCSPVSFTDAAYDDDGASPSPAFQHALTGADSAGDYRLVVYGHTGTHFTDATALPVAVRAD